MRRQFLVSVLVLMALLTPMLSASANTVPPGNDHFERTWARNDKPVADDQIERTWIWGPGATTDTMWEQYVDSPDGQREVQYFDKSRMEVNRTGAPEDSPWYVTNGLLVVEMVTGRIQVGDDEFEPHEADTNNVAGDRSGETGPTYASLDGLRAGVDDRGTEAITQIVHQDGNVTEDSGLAEQGVHTAHFDQVTGHNVAEPFWEFMNANGLIHQDGQFVHGAMFEHPVYATGRPITEPYWAHVPVDGDEQWVLLQAFERRVLTYTPDNPEGWKVEAGNVGRHYFEWRYGYPVDHDPPEEDDDNGNGDDDNGDNGPPPSNGDDDDDNGNGDDDNGNDPGNGDDDNGNGDDDNGNGDDPGNGDDDNGNGGDDDNNDPIDPPTDLGMGIIADASLLGEPVLDVKASLDNPSEWSGDVVLEMECGGELVDEDDFYLDAEENVEVGLSYETSSNDLLNLDTCTVTALIDDSVVDSSTVVVADVLPALSDVVELDLDVVGTIEANVLGSNLLTLNGTLTNETDIEAEVTLEADDGDGWTDEKTVTLGPNETVDFTFDRDVGGLVSIDTYTVTASVDGEEIASDTVTSVSLLDL